MASGPVYCVPDTNIFLHYEFFTNIPWAKEIGADAVTVVISDTVLGELAKFKRDPNRQQRRERARKAEARVVEMLGGTRKPATIRKNEELIYRRLDPGLRTMEAHNLHWEENDDRILTLALQMKSSETDARVVLYTGDGPMQIKADQLGIEVRTPSESLEREDEPDPRDQELAKLRREVAQYQSRLPDIELL